MIKKLALGILRSVHNVMRPITRRIALRLRALMRESVNPLESQVSQLTNALNNLKQHVEAFERMRDSTLHSRLDSLDYKFLLLANTARETQTSLALAEQKAALLEQNAALLEQKAALFEQEIALLAQKTFSTEPGNDDLRDGIEFIKSRLSSYAGPDTVLTYLKDESPIFVNTGDLGCPSPIINGGVWEPENTQILCSFLTASTIFLDIGANVGYYSIVMGNRLAKGEGRVLAFEPHPGMADLIERSLQLNHLEPVVKVHRIAASDHDGEVELFYPNGHVGQGSSVRHFEGLGQRLQARAHRLDSILPANLEVDLVKIDVEGAELAVLRGMKAIIQRSPTIKILFEKLAPTPESKSDETAVFFAQMDLKLYGIGPGATLFPLSMQEYEERVGDVIAARDGVIDELERSRFSVYPGQLLGHGQPCSTGTLYHPSGSGVLFFGPYWHLSAGDWSFKVHGTVTGSISLTIGTNDSSFQFQLTQDTLSGEFFAPHDLHHFELRALGDTGASIQLSKIELIRLSG
jgi:FkbM family methyltransferase